MAYKKILFRRDPASSWTSANPVLSAGEIGLETDTGKIKLGNGSTAWNSLSYFVGNLAGAGLDSLGDVTITSAANGDFLRWNGTAWINDAVNLSTDTVGNYVENLVAGTGVTLTNNSGEASTPTVAIGQAVGTSSSVTFAAVNAPLTGNVTGNVTGNSSTATTLQTSRTIELTGDVTGSASFNGSANASISATIAANSVALGTDTTGDYVSSLVAGTGVTLSNNSGESATPTIAIGQAIGTSASPTFAVVSLSGQPSQSTHAATKGYVDNIASGINWHEAVSYATTAVLPNTPTYDNGVGGVGATLTAGSNARLMVDGLNASTGNRILVKNQSTQTQNGIYDVTEQGSVGTPWILTRAADFNQDTLAGSIDAGEAVYVRLGNFNAGTGHVLTSTGTGDGERHIPGTDDFVFTQFSGLTTTVAGNGLTTNGTSISVGTASSGRIVVSADDIDLATVAQSNSTAADTLSFAKTVNVDSYGRVTGVVSASVDLSSKANIAGPTFTGTVVLPSTTSIGDVSSTEIGYLNNVTSSIQTQIDAKAPLDSPTFTGTVTLPDNTVALGTKTTGDYVSSLVAGTGVTLTNNSGEGATPTIAIGQSVATSASPTFANVTSNLVGNVTGNVTGDLTGNVTGNVSGSSGSTSGNAATATTLANARTISISGDVSGSVSFNGSANVDISATIQPNSVALGTDTTGNYMSGLTQGTGVTITHTPGEGSNATIAIGQAIGTSDSPTFAGLNVNGSIVFEGTTANEFETILSVTDPTDDRTITLPNVTGTVITTGDTGSVTSTMIADGTIVNGDINASAGIDKTKISGTAITAADTGTVTSTMISDGTIVNGDINASAAIALSKLASGTSGQIIVANSSGVPTWVSESGDVTISDTGVTAISSGVIVDADVNASAAIAHSKLANGTAGQVLLGTTTTGVITATTISGDITINGAGVASIAANSVALGTDTTGDYVGSLVAGTGVTLSNNSGEGATPTIAIGQAVGTSASVTFADITATGTVTLSADPASALQAATKQYVDNISAGINFHAAVVAATTGNLAGTYNNGTSGVGATITKASNGSIGTIDGATVVVGSRILVKSQTDSKQNGIYTVTAVGSVSAPWVVTRATDADNSLAGEMLYGDFCFVMGGSTNAGYGYINNSTANPIVIGTDDITYSAFNAAQTLTNGSGINLVSNVISVDTTTIQARVADVSDTEIGYLNGVTSAIQTQMDTKAPLASPTFTGTVTLPTGTVTSAMILDGTIANADINASAAIAHSKLANATDGQVLLGTTTTGVVTATTVSGDVTITGAGVTSIGSGVIVNADVNASAAIDYSKLAALTSGNILVGNASNVATSVAVTGDVTITNAGVTAIGSGVIVDADINASAAIDKTKISGTAVTVADTGTVTSAMIADATIVNGDISTTAAIAHSKLANATDGQVLLGTTTTGVVTATTVTGDVTITGGGVTAIGSGVIVNADINASAGIALSKLATSTAGNIIVYNSSGVPTAVAETGDVTISDTGVTAIASGVIVNADISATAAIDLGKLADVSTNAQTASYSLVLADKNKVVEMNVGSANNLTVPLNSSQAFPVGSQINILQTGSGQTTIVATGGVTINATPGLKIRAQWSYATLIKRATDTWVLVGDISA